jgi:prepilin-type N-terminal cleavage/methylation domain-containing protein
MFISFIKKIRLRQHGFTLIELLVALAITGLIVTGIMASIFQVISVSAASNARMMAVKQIEVAIDRMRLDIQMGQQISINDSDEDFLITNWTEWDSATAYNVKYSWNSTTHQLSRLPSNGALNVFAKNIASRPVVSQLDNGNWNITIVVTVEGYKSATETRTFEVQPRSSY